MRYDKETNSNGLILVYKDRKGNWVEQKSGEYMPPKRKYYVIANIGIPIDKLDYKYKELIKQYDAKRKQMLGQSASVTLAVYEKK